LDRQKCHAMLRDETNIFRRMWAAQAWAKMYGVNDTACWHRKRDAPDRAIPAGRFFGDALKGRYCETNWHSPYTLGEEGHVSPFHTNQAPASANTDNMCRNFEWLMCAALGKLPGQGGLRPSVRFAKAPNTLEPAELGQCHGWAPTDQQASFVFGYTVNDIFFLETCLLSEICSNHEQLFELATGQHFVCDFSANGYIAVQQILTSLWVEPEEAKQCTYASPPPPPLPPPPSLPPLPELPPPPPLPPGCTAGNGNWLFQQCGGIGFEGDHCCNEGHCVGEEWYMQCVP